MSTTTDLPNPLSNHAQWHSLADIASSLGVPANRIRFTPYPGTATENDCLRETESKQPCELIDGTLVEKAMGTPEGYLGMTIAHFLMNFVRPRRLGMVLNSEGLFRMYHGNIRLPDASFTKRERLPNPLPQIGGWCPDFCVEAISPGNTLAEMELKRKEYFMSGCKLMWIVNKKNRTVQVFENEFECVDIDIDGTLTGGHVLPGFVLTMKELFSEFDDYFPDSTTP